MKLTENQVLAIKRKRGELNMSIRGLERATGVSRWTLIDIFKHDHRNVNSKTFKKLNATRRGVFFNIIVHVCLPRLVNVCR